jgi:hypothetical protein
MPSLRPTRVGPAYLVRTAFIVLCMWPALSGGAAGQQAPAGSSAGTPGSGNPPGAQEDADKQKEYRKPSTVEDVAMSPLRDTNIDARDIPEELQQILDEPYARLARMNCAEIAKAVVSLDAVLGPDLDARGEPDTLWKKRERAAGRIAKSFVSGLIPFRSLVREISGASESDRRYRAAIDAGITRRAYLKGYGDARRCKPPASPLPRTADSPGANTAETAGERKKDATPKTRDK